jgi:RNase P/RNase MRP subunit POP5
VETEACFNKEILQKEIEAKIYYLFGVKGAVEINFSLIDFFPKLNDAIIRCNHNMLNNTRVVIAHISEINGKTARLDVKTVSGTLQTLKKKMGRRNINKF